MTLLSDTGSALAAPLQSLGVEFVNTLPGIVTGLIVIVLGFIIGSAFGFIIHKGLERSRLDLQMKKAGLAESVGFMSISRLIGSVVKWYIFSAFLAEGASKMQLGILSDMLERLALWIPNLIAAILILVGGLIVADYIAERMLRAKRSFVRIASDVVRWILIIYVVIIALGQVGIDVSIAANTMLILVAAVAVALGLAFGIGFGLALKDEAKGMLKAVKKRI